VLVLAIAATAVFLLRGRGGGPLDPDPTGGLNCTADANGSYPTPTGLDPASTEYRARQIADQIGAPTGWGLCHPPAWDGKTFHVDYQTLCIQGACPQVPTFVGSWATRVPEAREASDRITADSLTGCVSTTCRMSFRKDGFTVELTVRSSANGGPQHRAGDTLYVAGVTIRQS
jgi:hypothetical protein